MTTQAKTSRTLDTPQIPVQFKLAAAWTSFMFFYIYVDYLFLYKPGVVENILAGIVWEFEISETFVTTSIALLAIPILMIVLSMTLPARVNRATNIVAATLYIPFSIFNAVGESWTYFFGLSIGLFICHGFRQFGVSSRPPGGALTGIALNAGASHSVGDLISPRR